jgi:predicted nucleic acid-binding protein
VREAETAALRTALEKRRRLYTSRLAVVEVTRAAMLADPRTGFQNSSRLLETCELVDVDEDVVGRARTLVDERLRALDAIHLASALLVKPDELIAYDRRLVEAADRAGLATSSPGA